MRIRMCRSVVKEVIWSLGLVFTVMLATVGCALSLLVSGSAIVVATVGDADGCGLGVELGACAACSASLFMKLMVTCSNVVLQDC